MLESFSDILSTRGLQPFAGCLIGMCPYRKSSSSQSILIASTGRVAVSLSNCRKVAIWQLQAAITWSMCASGGRYGICWRR